MLEKLPESLGRTLHHRRAGFDRMVCHRLRAERSIPFFDVRSDAFLDEQPIPARHTADGAGLSPALVWRGLPPETHSVALIVEDPDAPALDPLVHAIVVNLQPRGSLPEGALDSPDHQGVGLTTGRNSFLRQNWLPPDPPPGHGLHRYVFQLFALDAGAKFSRNPGRHEFFDVVLAHALAAGSISGTYERAR